MRDEKFGLQFLEEFQDRLYVWHRYGNIQIGISIGRMAGQVQYQEGKLSAQAYRKICFENAKKIFK